MRFSKEFHSEWLTVAGILCLLVMFFFSKSYMAEFKIVETILAGGGSGISIRLVAIAFILLRFFVLFVLPGFLTSWVALKLIDQYRKNTDYKD